MTGEENDIIVGGLLTVAVLRAADLEASCLRGALPMDDNVEYRWHDGKLVCTYLQWTCGRFVWCEPCVQMSNVDLMLDGEKRRPRCQTDGGGWSSTGNERSPNRPRSC